MATTKQSKDFEVQNLLNNPEYPEFTEWVQKDLINPLEELGLQFEQAVNISSKKVPLGQHLFIFSINPDLRYDIIRKQINPILNGFSDGENPVTYNLNFGYLTILVTYTY